MDNFFKHVGEDDGVQFVFGLYKMQNPCLDDLHISRCSLKALEM